LLTIASTHPEQSQETRQGEILPKTNFNLIGQGIYADKIFDGVNCRSGKQ
jgi:hypothetical protein